MIETSSFIICIIIPLCNKTIFTVVLYAMSLNSLNKFTKKSMLNGVNFRGYFIWRMADIENFVDC